MFQGWKHKFQDFEHKFQDLEHKFPALKVNFLWVYGATWPNRTTEPNEPISYWVHTAQNPHQLQTSKSVFPVFFLYKQTQDFAGEPEIV